MNGWMRPIPLVGDTPEGSAAGALAIAGQGHVRFSHVVTGRGTVRPIAELDALSRSRLGDQRPALVGVALDRPRIMGILNVTPDSFSDGGTHNTVEAAVEHAKRMARDADIIDIGGESTRPGAEDVDINDEIQRTIPVIQGIRDAGITTPISIDTRKSKVADAAIMAGADIVNDVSAFVYDPELADLVAQTGVPVCLMHARGTPKFMQQDPQYDDVVAEVMDHLSERIDFAEGRGIAGGKIITDPGIGFGKSAAHNLTLLRNLSVLHDLGRPFLLGASRKRFIGTIGGADTAQDRMAGSVAVALHGVAQGAQILRVHDVAETAQALRLWLAIQGTGEADI